MENIVLIYVVALGLVVGLLVVQRINNDENLSERLVRVRVRVEEKGRRQPPEPPDEDIERMPQGEMLAMAAIFLFLVLLLRTM